MGQTGYHSVVKEIPGGKVNLKSNGDEALSDESP
jgi:hypothetical protein